MRIDWSGPITAGPPRELRVTIEVDAGPATRALQDMGRSAVEWQMRVMMRQLEALLLDAVRLTSYEHLDDLYIVRQEGMGVAGTLGQAVACVWDPHSSRE